MKASRGQWRSVSLRVRISTRLAWLDLTKSDFAAAIGMDKSVLSRALRADSPHRKTLEKISAGLGLTVEELVSGEAEVLLSDHPVLGPQMSRGERMVALESWATGVLEDF